jgi:hypothetical protein
VSEILVYDLYCGAGGVGLALVEIAEEYNLDLRVVGIDRVDHSDTYPGEFVLADASRPPLPKGAALVWTSPPCLAYTRLNYANAVRHGWDETPRERYPTFEDLSVHEVVPSLGEEYIIENVPLCDDLRDPVRLNGLAFSKPYKIQRHFETSFEAPDRVGRGSPEITVGRGYNKREVAAAKGVPSKWSESAVNSAIPREYVQYLLHYCPTVGGGPVA